MQDLEYHISAYSYTKLDMNEEYKRGWNDAIEAAAALAAKGYAEGGIAKSLAFFAKAEDHWVYKQACMDYAGAILALKK